MPRKDDAAPLILASASQRRRDLLQGAGIRCEVTPSRVVERINDRETPSDFARRMAAEKAAQVAEDYRDRRDTRVVLGADTVVILDGVAIGKPEDRSAAAAMLARLSGRTHRVITAVSLVRADGTNQPLHVTTEVRFRRLDASEIERYLDRSVWHDKAGAYAIQEHAAYMVAEIVGSYTNVVGLPLSEVLDLLCPLGIVPNDD